MVGVLTEPRRMTGGQMAATSTPIRQNGNLTHSSSNGSSIIENGPGSPGSPTDQVFADIPSPVSSPSSTLGRSRTLSGGSAGRKSGDFEYGKFYTTSYLEKSGEQYIKKGPSPVPSKSPTHTNFSRPEGFSYKYSPQYGKTGKKSDTRSPSSREGGMMGALVRGIRRKFITKKKYMPHVNDPELQEPIKLSHFPDAHVPKPNEPKKIERDDWPCPPFRVVVVPDLSSIQRKQIRETSKAARGAVLKNEEPIKLSQFPAGNKPKPNEPTKMERDDWPGPPCPAALMPERLRERRRSRGESEYGDDDDEDIRVPVDPKLKKEIDEMSKIKDSAMAKVMLEKLEDVAHEVKARTLDPRSSSRTPAANKEPHIATRYDNPIGASPSRNTERPRMHSVDDILLEKNLHARTTVSLPRQPIRPGYTLSFGKTRSKSSTLPVGKGADGSYLTHNGSAIESDDDDGPSGPKSYSDLDRLERKWQGMHLSASLDPEVFKRNISSRLSTYSEISSYSLQRDKLRASAISDGPPFLATQALERRRKSTSTLSHKRDELCRDPEQPVPYDDLKCVNGVPPKGYDKETLERHLSNEQFEEIFNVKRTEFYRMPEWKRNDLKTKHHLY